MMKALRAVSLTLAVSVFGLGFASMAQASVSVIAQEADDQVYIQVYGVVTAPPSGSSGAGSDNNFFFPEHGVLIAGFGQYWSLDTWDVSGGPASWGAGGPTYDAPFTGDLFFFLANEAGGFRLVSGMRIVETTFTLSGSFASLGLDPGIYNYTLTGAGGATDALTVNVVPEPSTWILSAVGLGSLCLLRCRRLSLAS